ncbi:MAG TPA: response regulator [Flavobacteriaceae bacterium]|nr:response regulator [Flavobacteriaceae bacterium]
MKSMHILLVEDNRGDILLTTETLEESKVPNTLSVVRNGKDAINYVKNTNGFEDAVTPDLILLDVNLPFINGHEVLATLKNEERLKHIPVIMLTTSTSVGDIGLSNKYHANCYITKPMEVNDFFEAIKTIEGFENKLK